MKTVSITPATSGKARLRGVALASVIIALMLSLLLEALDQTIVGTAMPRIIAVLAIGGYLFSLANSSTEQEIALNNQHEATLQDYLDKISELLLEKHLLKSPIDDEVRTIARVRTLTVLRRIDGERKASVLRFLYESDLIIKDKPIIHLEDADLSEAELIVANLSGADLNKAHLFKANLNSANLSRANLLEAGLTKACLFRANLLEANLHGASLLHTELRAANLHGADLSEADLSHADLSGGFDLGPTGFYWDEPVWRVTDLSEADLSKANLSEADLSEAKLIGATLRGAILRDTTLLDADLSGADLSGATIAPEQLDKAKSKAQSCLMGLYILSHFPSLKPPPLNAVVPHTYPPRVFSPVSVFSSGFLCR